MTIRWIAAAVLLIGSAPGCSPRPATAANGAAAEELVVRKGTFQGRLLLTGELEAVHAERITIPRTPSWPLPIMWMETDGAPVTEGQKVLELDNSQFAGELEQKRLAESSAYNDLARKRADVSVATAEKQYTLEQRRIEMEKARIDAEIPEELRSLRDHQDSQLAYARAKSEHAKALEDLASTRLASEAEVEELRIALERAQGEIETAESAIEALTISAPRDGILVVAENRGEGRKYQVGDNVWVGLAVMRIPDLDSMKVVARLSDVDDGQIEVGMRAVCTLDTYPEQSYAGEVAEIAPIAQEDDHQSLRRSFRVEIMLETADPEKMRPGMSVKAEVMRPATEDVLIAPRAALDLSTDPARALLADGSDVEVGLGECGALECVVERGLSDGDRLRSGS